MNRGDTIVCGEQMSFKLFAETTFRVTGPDMWGIEFQIEGPATENALLASFVLVLGTTKWPRDAERKRSSLQMLHSSAKYDFDSFSFPVYFDFCLTFLPL